MHINPGGNVVERSHPKRLSEAFFLEEFAESQPGVQPPAASLRACSYATAAKSDGDLNTDGR